jgi:hypothetical protein
VWVAYTIRLDPKVHFAGFGQQALSREKWLDGQHHATSWLEWRNWTSILKVPQPDRNIFAGSICRV